MGQLARDVTPKHIYLKSQKISLFDNKCITEISCGYYHSLAFTSDGQVYGWGRNCEGQVGFEIGADYL